MATVSRGDVTLTPDLIMGWELTREARSVVHSIIGTDEVVVTARPPAPPAGELRLIWTDAAAAHAAADELSIPGGAWTWSEPDALAGDFVAYVSGRVTVAALDDEASAWQVTVEVQGVGT